MSHGTRIIKRKVIAICGFQSSGKDTLADILVEHHGFRKLAFASTVKDVVSSIFGWDRTMIEGATPETRLERERIHKWWADKLDVPHLTPRWTMQHIGTELFRTHFNDKIWIYALQRKIDEIPHQNIVITDCRFPNEIQALREIDASFIHIYRGELPPWFFYLQSGSPVTSATSSVTSATSSVTSATSSVTSATSSVTSSNPLDRIPEEYRTSLPHSSEWAWIPDMKFHLTIPNNGTIEDLSDTIHKFINDIPIRSLSTLKKDHDD